MLSSEISKLMKVTFIGSPAVGKTTMLRLLSKNLIDKFYFPTHGFDLKTIKLDDYNVRVWDFGGQHSYFKTYSRDYLLGSDVVFVDGNGILHHYNFGIASHLGIQLELPTLGVAKKLLVGTYDKTALKSKGSISPIVYNKQEIGAAVLSREGYNPIFVSSGHLISLSAAIDLVLKCTRWRIPEPTRLADKFTRNTIKGQKTLI